MRQLRALIERVAGAASTVLISGETGTGKELVALAHPRRRPRAPTSRSSPSTAPRLPEHAAGERAVRPRARRLHGRVAATGAACSSRPTGGTLFLDEIGDLPLPLQGKLLRVLQSGEVRPVGSETALAPSTCAASPPRTRISASWSSKGLFREDLFFRLDVLRVPVPALRERADDIPLLVEHFLRRSLRALAALGAGRLRAGGARLPGPLRLAGQRAPAREPDRAPGRDHVGAARASLADVQQALGPRAELDPMALLLQKPLTLARARASATSRACCRRSAAASQGGRDPGRRPVDAVSPREAARVGRDGRRELPASAQAAARSACRCWRARLPERGGRRRRCWCSTRSGSAAAAGETRSRRR